MLAATVVDALFPVAAAAAVSAYAPLMVGAGLVAGLGAGSAVYLVVVARPLLAAAARDAATLGRHITTPTFALAALGRLDRPLFVAAVALAGPSLPTLVHGLTPIAYMLVLQHSMGSGRYRLMGVKAVPMLVLAVVGVSLVVMSQPNAPAAGGWPALAGGGALTAVSVTAAALTALHLIWGVNYAAAAAPRLDGRRSEIAASMLGTVLASVLAVPGLVCVGLVVGGAAASRMGEAFLAGAVIGVLLRSPYVVLLRMANFATVTVTVNAITYLSPVVSLWLLTVCGHAVEVDLSAALAGGALIVAANLILAAQRAAAAAPG